MLGSFGLGNKAPLATGVEFYSLKTAHNGREFQFIIYKDKIDSVIGKWADDGTLNDFITFSNGYKVYYNKTSEKNYAEISWEVKKHHKKQYLDAVKSQLLYFKNPIDFRVDNGYGGTDKIDFQFTPVFENDDFIISNQNYYNKPHLVINGVCYGYIEFQELELEQKYGSVGVKVDINKVSVTPSRESCIWDSKTKDCILGQYQKMVEFATTEVSKILGELNLLDWLYQLNTMEYKNSSNFLGTLFHSTDIKKSSLKHSSGYKYSDQINIVVGSNDLNMVRVCTDYKGKTQYNLCSNTSNLNNVILQFEDSIPRKIKYCLNQFGEFTTFRFTNPKVKEIVRKFIYDEISYEEAILSVIEKEVIGESEKDETIEAHKVSNKNIVKFFKELKTLNLKIYDDIEVPDDFTYNEKADTVESGVVVPKVDLAKLRKKQAKILLHYTYADYEKLTWKSFEALAKNVEDIQDTVIYGNKEDDELLQLIYIIKRKSKRSDYHNDFTSSALNSNLKIWRVNKSANKHFKNHISVKDYIINDNVLCNEIRDYLTSQYIKNSVPGYSYMTNCCSYSIFSDEFITAIKKFDLLGEYFNTNMLDKLIRNNYPELNQHFAIAIKEYYGEELTDEEKAVERVDNLINIEYLELGVYLKEFNDNYRMVLQQVLTSSNYGYSTEQVTSEILHYIKSKQTKFNYLKEENDNSNEN